MIPATRKSSLAAALVVMGLVAACTDPSAGPPAQPQPNDEIEAQRQALSQGILADGVVPFSVGMDLGTGIDTATGGVLSQADCLDFSGQAVEIESYSYTPERSRFRVFRDKSELREVLDISGKISATFGVVRVGIEAEYYDEIVRDENSIFVLVEYDVLTRGYSIISPTMTVDGLDGRNGRPDNRDGSVPGSIRNYFGSDYDVFRRKCGDRYLHGVVTGGRYVAVLEVRTTNRLDKNLVAGELEGTYLPLMITVRGGLELFFEDLETNHEVKVHVLSRGDNRSDNVVSLSGLEQPDEMLVSDLIDDIKRFRAAVVKADEEAAGSTLGYRRGALYAMYSSYDSTAKEVPRDGRPAQGGPEGSPRQARSNQVEQLQAYRDAFASYTNLAKHARDALVRPDRYAEADAVALELVETEARWSQSMLERASGRCALALSPVCRSLEQLGLTGPEELQEKLPMPRAPRPRDCKEVRDRLGDTEDGEKIVYLGGRSDEPFSLWCADMEKADPVAYLSLRVFDPASQSPGTNYARVLGGNDVDGAVVPDALSIYEKLRVHISDDGLVVVPGQADFVVDGAGTPQPDDEQVPWGSARTCRRGRRLAAVADLSGTGFAFADDVNHRIVEPSVYVETEPMTWVEAYRFAQSNDAHLLHVSDVREQTEAAQLLKDYGIKGAWMGMMNSRSRHRTFRWMDRAHTPYRNWAPGFPRARPREQACAWLDDEGLFRDGPCRERRPFVAERRRVRFEAEGAHAQELRLFVDGRLNCGTVVPEPELRLRYVGGAL